MTESTLGHVIKLNGKWPLWLPEHRADRAEWTSEAGWERERLDSMHANIKPGDIVYDVGSEEADISALLATWCRNDFVVDRRPMDSDYPGGVSNPRGGVVLFEGNPRVWPNARVIFEMNNLRPRGTFAGFAGDHQSTRHVPATLTSDWPDCAYGPVISDHNFVQLNERPDLPSISLDEYVSATGLLPQVVSMDVEGSELRVLEGMSGLLQTSRPLVYISVHPDFLREQYHETEEDLYKFLSRHEYEFRHIADDHERHVVGWHYTNLAPK